MSSEARAPHDKRSQVGKAACVGGRSARAQKARVAVHRQSNGRDVHLAGFYRLAGATFAAGAATRSAHRRAPASLAKD
jgi:hypothetical protein